MPLKTTDNLLGPSRVSDQHVTTMFSKIDRPSADDYEFIARLRHWCRVAGVDDANAISQVLWETANLTSIRYVRDRNPIGLGITSDGTIQPFAIKTVDESARVTVQAIYAMVKKAWHPDVPMPASTASWMDAVWLPKVRDPKYPPGVSQVKHQNIMYSGNRATWAADPAYMGHVDRFNRMVPGVPDQGTAPSKPDPKPTPGIPSGWKLYPVAGLSVPIALPVPLIQDLIPRSQTLQRPGIKRQLPGFWVQHETGNPAPGADAVMHNRYMHNGAPGPGGQPQQLGYHFTSDDKVIYQMLPIDEVSWQAADGGGPGNMSGISNELCINRGIDYARSRSIAEALAAGVLGALGMGADRVKRHWDFNFNSSDRHHCPDLMMSSGYWPTFVANVGKLIAATPEPQPEPEPSPEEKHQLPDWMTPELANRLFGAYVAPWGPDGGEGTTIYRFDIGQAPSQKWVATGKRTGQWPAISTVIRRGNGNEMWVWSNGETYERKLADKDAA